MRSSQVETAFNDHVSCKPNRCLHAVVVLSDTTKGNCVSVMLVLMSDACCEQSPLYFTPALKIVFYLSSTTMSLLSKLEILN